MSVTACATRHILENIHFFSDEILVILARRHLADRMELRLLNDKEQARYHAYVFEADKQRHLLAHGLKRQILSKLTGLASASLQFDTGPAGKPYLSGQRNKGIHFNMSHSGDWVALAFSQSHPVGIDVEQARDIDYRSLLPAIVHPRDDLLFSRQSAEMNFLANWSMKEAVAKCMGSGLSVPFTSLRLNNHENANYTCSLSGDSWHVQHLLHGDTHFAIAVPDVKTGRQFRTIEIQ